MALIQSTAISNADDYEIDQSLRFNDDDTAYLSRTPASAGNRRTWTFSCWFKWDGKNDCRIFQVGSSLGTSNYYGISSYDGKLNIEDAGSHAIHSTALFRDPSAWYHIVLAMDTTQSTASNRVKIYINREQVTDFSNSATYPAQNNETAVNRSGIPHAIGAEMYAGPRRFMDGYIAEVHFIDGQALTPASFGKTGTYGEWKPILVTDTSGASYTSNLTYGTNGFYLPFDSTSALGADRSPNDSNHWTVNNLTASDQVVDSPTNNFCTFNPIYWNPVRSNTGTYSEGNLKQAGITDCMSEGTMAAASGKWYYEVLQNGDNMYGAGVPNQWGGDNPGCNDWGIGTHSNTHWHGESSSGATTHTTYTTGDIVGIAFDVDAKKIWMSRNGTWSGANPSTGNSAALFNYAGSYSLVPAMRSSNGNSHYTIANFGQDSSFAGAKTAQGNQDGNNIGDFYYTPPTGFLALCTKNLPDVDVVPGKHFNTVLYTGNNGASLAVSGVGFQPDFTWIKERSSTSHHFLMDAVRGATKFLQSSTTITEVDNSDVLQSFDSDGFTVGTSGGTNASDTYASWNWKANGSGSSNTNGSITTTVSANTDAGFSIISYTGTGSNATIGHGLSKAPEMWAVKPRTDVSDNQWFVCHTGLASDYATDFIHFDTNGAKQDNALMWNDTPPTSSVINLGSKPGTNNSGGSFICYAWHSVDGYSKVGSFEGNSNADGTFVYTGFRPAFVLMKCADSSTHWYMYDSARNPSNVVGEYISANDSGGGSDDVNLDFVSNGFKMRTAFGGLNNNTMIYIAFAETPFKYSNAR